jgi:hypothetical protein
LWFILQIVVESSSLAQEYGDLSVDENSPVNPDLHFDSQLMHLYVMTEKKVRLKHSAPYQLLASLGSRTVRRSAALPQQ